ncbi:nuclear transport factor 2 family protein [Kineococcus sp. SYSU DK001]|uniref:nuclear transport factor 2 family protein n=1 Tax=Kineococcus sp. SYSU DK001 TaxID=3383122 RepID=UPI003D7DB036
MDVTETVERTLLAYFQLCDVPAGEPLGLALSDLFTPDAVWEGVGDAYDAKFGRHEGRDAVLAVLARYLPPQPHFRANVHLLSPGIVDPVEDGTARGSWTMQQLSRYEDGTSEVLVARLDVTFELPGGEGSGPARISRFRTRRMFSHPLPGVLSMEEVSRVG